MSETLQANPEKPLPYPYYWEKNGVRREFESPDKDDVPLADYRLNEAEAADLALTTSDFVHIRTNSGFGISQFFIPKMEDLLKKRGKVSKHLTRLDSDWVDVAKDDKHFGDILLLDELQESEGGLAGGFEALAKIRQQSRGMDVVVMYDDLTDKDFNGYIQKLTGKAIAPVVMNPKLFNLNQAVEYTIHGSPFLPHDQDDTFFTELDPTQIRTMLEVFNTNYPLHFRLLKVLNNQMVKNESYEERLELIQKNWFEKRLDTELNNSFLGIKRTVKPT